MSDENETSEGWKKYFTKMTENLHDRMDKHSCEYRDNFKVVFSKLDDLREAQHRDKEQLLKKINEVELNAVKSEGSINTKLAVANGTIALIVSGLTTWISDKVLRGGQ